MRRADRTGVLTLACGHVRLLPHGQGASVPQTASCIQCGQVDVESLVLGVVGVDVHDDGRCETVDGRVECGCGMLE